MRLLIVVLATLLGLILLILLIGAMLPKNHTARGEITVNRPAEDVWKLITGHENESKWRADVTGISRLPDRNGHEVWEETYKDGQKLALETLTAAPPSRLVRKIVDQSAFGGTWTYELIPSADGKSTTLRITEDGEVYNPVFRFVSHFFIPQDATIRKYLASVQKTNI